MQCAIGVRTLSPIKSHTNLAVGKVKHATYVGGTRGPHKHVPFSFPQQLIAEGAVCMLCCVVCISGLWWIPLSAGVVQRLCGVLSVL